jgi:cephalosporin hydroxylase
MCAEDKMHAVIEVMRRAPPGDIVEIGSWWGRSAALFVWLSTRYSLGKVLCVDPWLVQSLSQGDPLLDGLCRNLDTEEALRMFEINLAPLGAGRLNYIRAPSVEGAASYKADPSATTEAFGATRYEGRIAVLHIDGNHAYEQVAQDEAAWTPLVAPGGWIIFDDYEWAFGDGPRRVADAFVAREASRIDASFVAGPSLFVKLKGDGRG